MKVYQTNEIKNISLLGSKGSGKTTLVDLILRAYNVPDGTLYIDGALNEAASCLTYIKKDGKKITFYCLNKKPEVDQVIIINVIKI